MEDIGLPTEIVPCPANQHRRLRFASAVGSSATASRHSLWMDHFSRLAEKAAA
jgi:hypothetical protein